MNKIAKNIRAFVMAQRNPYPKGAWVFLKNGNGTVQVINTSISHAPGAKRTYCVYDPRINAEYYIGAGEIAFALPRAKRVR